MYMQDEWQFYKFSSPAFNCFFFFNAEQTPAKFYYDL